MKGLKVWIKGENLVVELPMNVPPVRSWSGKSLVVATTGGVKRVPLEVDGRPLRIIVNAFIYDELPVKYQNLLDWEPDTRSNRKSQRAGRPQRPRRDGD
jgi:hypothetical protein